MTIDNLADWIRSNKVDVINHEQKIDLTQEEINEFQKEVTLASIQIDKLKETEKFFKETVKKGTPWDNVSEHHRPFTVTIPPTKGLEKLEANRTFAATQVANGYKLDITPVYLIPWPEFEKMVAMDIEGNEWSKYSRNMTRDEVIQHGKPILKGAEEARDILKEAGIEVEKVEGNTVHMSIDKKSKRKDLDLLGDEPI